MANFCEKCGSPLTKDDMFCPNCGTKVDNSMPVAPAWQPGTNAAQYAGGYTKSKSKLIPIIAAALALILVIGGISLFTGKSRGIKGTWYDIDIASADSDYNIEITGDSLTFDYMTFQYDRDGDYIYVNVLGETKTFRIGKYNGEKVLFEDGRSYPSYARTLKGAEKLFYSEE